MDWSKLSREAVQSAAAASLTKTAGNDASVIFATKYQTDLLQTKQIDKSHGVPDGQTSGSPDLRVFFATDRRLDDGAAHLADKFANSESPSSTVHCGEVNKAAKGKFGTAQEPELVPGGKILDGAACERLVADAARSASGKLLVFVHGYRNSFRDALETGLAFARDADIQGTFLIWSWPSGAELSSYGYDEESVQWSEPQFDDFVDGLEEEKGIKDLDFFAHSMGTRLVANLMRDRWMGRKTAIALAAADLPAPLFVQSLNSAKSASTTLLATNADRALRASRIVHGRPRVGKADPLFLYKGLDTIDLSSFDQILDFNHSHAFDIFQVVKDLGRLFRGQWRAAARGLHTVHNQAPAIDYYVIEP